MSRFQVLFSGEVARGASEATVRQNMMRRLGLDERKVAQLFSGRTVVVRSDLTREAADALQAELAELGAIARIKNAAAPDDKAQFKIDRHVDRHPNQTLKDITAAHIECPRCGHLQLESEFCARCGVDIAAAAKQKRKEDLLIEKRIRELKEQKASSPKGAEPADEDVSERIEPIKRRIARPRSSAPARAANEAASPRRAQMSTRPHPGAQARPPRPIAQPDPSRSDEPANPFGGGFWRNVLKLGRKDEQSP